MPFGKPPPCQPSAQPACGVDLDPQGSSEVRNIITPVVGFADKVSLLLCDGDFRMFLAAIVRPVLNPILRIPGSRIPAKMVRVDAPTNPALVCRIPKFGRARSMLDRAYHAVDAVIFSLVMNMGISSRIQCVGPENTVPRIGRQSRPDKIMRFRHFGFMHTHCSRVNRRLLWAF